MASSVTSSPRCSVPAPRTFFSRRWRAHKVSGGDSGHCAQYGHASYRGYDCVRRIGGGPGTDLGSACPGPKGVRGWLRSRLLSFGLILAVGFLLLVSLTISTALAALRKVVAERFSEVVVVLAGVLDLRHLDRPRHRSDRPDLSLPAGETAGVAADSMGSLDLPPCSFIWAGGPSACISVTRPSPQRLVRRPPLPRCSFGSTTPRKSSCSARSSPPAWEGRTAQTEAPQFEQSRDSDEGAQECAADTNSLASGHSCSPAADRITRRVAIASCGTTSMTSCKRWTPTKATSAT